jgi:hypothetical protein
MKWTVSPLLAALGLTACPMQHPGTESALTQPDMGRSVTSRDFSRDTRAMPSKRNESGGFDQTLSLQGISFHVSSANRGSRNLVRIEPYGLQGDKAVMEKDIEGSVTGAEVADLNEDRSPEIYVYATSAGSGSHGSLIGYGANKRKSLSEIYLPSLLDDPRTSTGYMGHDEFRVAGNTLVRRFPVYRDEDTNAQPTGVIRQVQYHLLAGEAGWVLKPNKVLNY